MSTFINLSQFTQRFEGIVDLPHDANVAYVSAYFAKKFLMTQLYLFFKKLNSSLMN